MTESAKPRYLIFYAKNDALIHMFPPFRTKTRKNRVHLGQDKGRPSCRKWGAKLSFHPEEGGSCPQLHPLNLRLVLDLIDSICFDECTGRLPVSRIPREAFQHCGILCDKASFVSNDLPVTKQNASAVNIRRLQAQEGKARINHVFQG